MRWEKKSKGRAETREGNWEKKDEMLNISSQMQNLDSNTKDQEGKRTNKNKVQLHIKYENLILGFFPRLFLFYLSIYLSI